MIVNIICTEDEYKNILKPLGIDKIKIIKKDSNAYEVRMEFIKKNLVFGITLEQFYRRLNKKGYTYNRKTLRRDLRELENEGFCIIETSLGGRNGSTTEIKLPNN